MKHLGERYKPYYQSVWYSQDKSEVKEWLLSLHQKAQSQGQTVHVQIIHHKNRLLVKIGNDLMVGDMLIGKGRQTKHVEKRISERLEHNWIHFL